MKKLTLCFSVFMLNYFVVNAQNIIPIAGVDTSAYGGDGGPATAAELNQPADASFDNLGNLYIADWQNNRIRVINTSGIINTIAGNGWEGFYGDGGPATAAEIGLPNGVAADAAGNIYYTDAYSMRIREVNTSGIISTIGGNGHYGFYGDGGPATAAEIANPGGIQVDFRGNVFFADSYNQRVRCISTSGIITTVAGSSPAGYSGDGGPATAAQFSSILGMSIDAAGDIFISDFGNYRIRMVNTGGVVNTIAGNGVSGYYGDGGPATDAEVDHVWGVWVDIPGNVYIADWYGNRIRMVNTSGIISTLTGDGTGQNTGDGGPATAAEIAGPAGVVTDQCGNLFITEFSSKIREIVYDSNCELGIKNIKSNEVIETYPNPSSDNLNVVMHCLTGKITVSLINYLGQSLINNSYSGQDLVMLNTATFANGIYFLKVQPESGSPIIRKVEIVH